MHMDKEQFLQMLQSQQASGLSINAYFQTNGYGKMRGLEQQQRRLFGSALKLSLSTALILFWAQRSFD